jgi:hypothetical protein
MKKLLWAMLCATSLLALGCGGPAHPEEAEVKAAITGAYCTDNVHTRVELTMDGRYQARRNGRGAFGTGFIGEKCAGKYALVYDEDKHVWNLQFEKADEYSNPFVKCAGHSVAVWEFEKGYAKIDSVMRITDPFEQNELKKDCGTGL